MLCRYGLHRGCADLGWTHRRREPRLSRVTSVYTVSRALKTEAEAENPSCRKQEPKLKPKTDKTDGSVLGFQ